MSWGLLKQAGKWVCGPVLQRLKQEHLQCTASCRYMDVQGHPGHFVRETLSQEQTGWDVALWEECVGSGFRPQYILNWVLWYVLRILDTGVCLLIVSQGLPGLRKTLSQNREGRSDSGRRFSVKQISLSLPLMFLMLLKVLCPHQVLGPWFPEPCGFHLNSWHSPALWRWQIVPRTLETVA